MSAVKRSLTLPRDNISSSQRLQARSLPCQSLDLGAYFGLAWPAWPAACAQ